MNSKDKTANPFHSGHVALLGRPNVGKSTLLNAIVGEKLSIVTAKPHTTRNRILGVLNRPDGQAIFIDTPGYAPRSGRVLHRLMARSLKQTQEDADLIVLVTDATSRVEADEALLSELSRAKSPVILAINKLDRLKSKERLLPRIDALRRYPFMDFIPISARTGKNVDRLETAILAGLPEGPKLYPDEFKTDQTEVFRAAEIIREKLMSELHQEIPYGLAVQIEAMRVGDDGRRTINAVIWVERDRHKAIVIGKDGRVLKRIGRLARLDLNRLFPERVHLEVWVKVREHWSDNAEELKRLGYDSL